VFSLRVDLTWACLIPLEPFSPRVQRSRFKGLGIDLRTVVRVLCGQRQHRAVALRPQGVMGHSNITTTQRDTHLRPVHELPAHERLAQAVPIADLVTAPWKRAAKSNGVGKRIGTLPETSEERVRLFSRDEVLGPPTLRSACECQRWSNHWRGAWVPKDH
jgi:hypothetical protein